MNQLLGMSKGVLEQDSRATFAASDFEEDIDSTILVREIARSSKLEPAFSKKSGGVLEETEHTITFLPQAKRKASKLVKEEMAKAISPPKVLEEGKRKKVAKVSETPREVTKMKEMLDDEMSVPTSDKLSEITPFETNLESDKETSSEEENNKSEDEP